MILLDTHSWLWWLSSPELLSVPARTAVDAARDDGSLAVSAISVWEVALLVKKGRLELALPVDDLVTLCEQLPNLAFVPLTPRIALRSVALEPLHPDPADRFIAATAQAHGATLVTKDERLRAFDGITRLW